jgi:alkenylglycerophosphocholine hydrolase
VRRFLLPVAAAVCALYLAGLAFDSYPRLRLALKPLPVLCLALWVGSGDRDAFARRITLGLLLSALGDLLLEWSPGLFLPGLGAFLLAHLSYLAAFVADTRRPALGRLLPFAAWVGLAFLVLRPGLGTLHGPVVVYMAAILAMMWRAAARVGGLLASGRGQGSAWAALGGATLFAASDTLIAFDRFRAAMPAMSLPIIILYWMGQLGLAESARRQV